MRLSTTVSVPPVADVELLRRVVAHLVTAVRSLPVEDGAPVDARGRRCPGIVVSGVHPRPGTVYRVQRPPRTRSGPTAPELTAAPVEAEVELVALRRRGEWDAVDDWYTRWAPPRSGAGGREVGVELLTDTSTALTVAVQDGTSRVELELVRPQLAEAVVARVHDAVAAPSGFFAGACNGEATVRLDRLPPRQDAKPQITATGSHRRGTGRLSVRCAPQGELWEVEVRARLRGAGLLRPVVFLGGLLARRPVERALARDVPEHLLPVRVTRVLQACGPHPDPAEVAAVLLEGVLAEARAERR